MSSVVLGSAEDALDLLRTLGAVPHWVQHHCLVAEAAVELCKGLGAAVGGVGRFAVEGEATGSAGEAGDDAVGGVVWKRVLGGVCGGRRGV
jgi:hypothetical protein